MQNLEDMQGIFWLEKGFVSVTLNWGRRKGQKKPVCYIRQRSSFHIFGVLFPDLSQKGSSISMSPGDAALGAAWNPWRGEGNTQFFQTITHFVNWLFRMICAPAACCRGSVFGSHPWGAGPVVPTLSKHPGRATPATKDLLSKQTQQGKNSSRRTRNQLKSEPRETEAWDSDFQPSNLLLLTASSLGQGVDGTKENCGWLGIFNYWELYIPLDMGAPRDSVPSCPQDSLEGAQMVAGRWPSQQKCHPSKETGGGHSSCEMLLLKHLHISQHQAKKLFVLWI